MLSIIKFQECRGYEKVAFILITLSIVVIFLCEIIIPFEVLTVDKPFSRRSSSNMLVDTYYHYFHIVWLVGYVSTVFYMARRFYNSFGDIKNFIRQLIFTAVMTVVFLVGGLLIGSRMENTPDRYYTVVLGAFSFLAVCIGWLITTQLTRKYEETKAVSAANQSRKNHSINLVMQLSMSESFQNHLSNIKRQYPGDSIIPKDDFILYVNSPKDLDKEKYEAIASILFICDQYEFMSYGIMINDFDSETVYNMFYGAMRRTHTKASECRQVLVTGEGLVNAAPQPKAYEYLTAYINSNTKRYNDEVDKIVNAGVKGA